MRVFISYRRSDNRHLAGRLQDRLADAFGDDNVFYDVDSIPVGADFRQVIADRLAAVDVVVALVGPGFAPERLARPDDVVRLELTTAFDLGVPVIPVLVDDAAMPAPSSLPPELQRLAHLHATPLRPDPDFRPDTTRLLTAIQGLATPPTPAGPPPTPACWGPAPVLPRRPRFHRRGEAEVVDDPSEIVVDAQGPKVTAVAFSPDGTLLAAAVGEATIRIWDPHGTGPWGQHAGGPLPEIRPVSSPTSLAFSPRDRLLASWGTSNTVELHDPIAGRQVDTLHGHDDRVTSVAFSPNGTLLASGGVDGILHTWRPDRREPRWVARTGEIHAVAFSPDGRLLASAAGFDATIRLWDPSTGTPVHDRLRAPGRQVRSLAFSADGSQLAGGTADGSIVVWAPSAGRHLHTIKASKSGVRRVAFSPDGSYLASVATGNEVRLWDPGTGERLATLTGHSVAVRDLAFSPDASILATCGGVSHGTSRSEVFLWNVGGVG